MSEQEELVKAIAAIEGQREVLGATAVEAALAGLRQRLASLETPTNDPISKEATGWLDERKLVTILFADLSGFTALSEKTDPETVLELINACFSRLAPIVEKYEGTIEKFIGDEIMVMFGAPVAHEDDAERGVLAALEFLETLAGFNTERGANLELHIGVDTGPVVAGKVGAEGHRQYSVTGDAVNLAARLTDAAGPGKIFVGPHTYQLTAVKFDYLAFPPMRFKGKEQPVPVYQVNGLKEQPGRSRGLEGHGISSPLVGRSAEFQQLSACFERLMEKRGGLAIVYGEAGLGKSRLIAEIHRNLPSGSVLWLEGALLAYGQNLSYWPFQEILRKYFGILEEDDESTAWDKLEARISLLFQENTAEIAPYLASLLKLNVPEKYQERVKYLDGEAMGKQIFLATRRFFERLSREQPVALVFEDMHWIDASSESLLEHILSLISANPLLIIGLSRPGPQVPAGRIVQAAVKIDPALSREIHLSPLTGQESRQLIQNLLRSSDFSGLQESVIAKAEGNPFFLEEVIRTLIDRQVVVRDPARGAWRVTEGVGTITIPDTIQGLISARLDRLDEEVKQVLRLASVIGRSFLYRILCAISEDMQHVDDRLNELLAIELISEKQRVPEIEYMFKHALAQEVTYESILLQKRRELHARVAAAIETLFADRMEEFYSLLAYHYAKADSWEKALGYLVKAGNQAGQIAGDVEALEYYRQAMDAYGRMYGDRWDPVQRVTLEHRIGEALYRRGENMEALKYFKAALTHLGNPIPDSRSVIRRAILFGIGKQLVWRLARRKYKTDLASEFSPVIEETLRLYFVIAWITVMFDQEFFLYIILISWELAYKNHHPLMANGFSSLGIIFDFLSAHRLASGYQKSALEVAKNAKQPDSLGLVYYGLTLHEAMVGNFDRSLEYGLQARQVYWETGDLRGWGLISETIGQDLIYKGEFRQSWEVGQKLLDLGNEVGDPELRCWGMLVLGTTEYYLGRLEEARLHLSQSTELADLIPDYYGYLFARGQLGQCLLALGETEAALTILEECRQFSIQHRMRGNTLTPPYHGLLMAYLLFAGQNDQAQRASWLAKAGAASKKVRKQARAFHGGLPEALLLLGHLERLQGKPAKTRRLWQRSLHEAERMVMPYHAALAHWELGKLLNDPDHLTRAKNLFSDLGLPETGPTWLFYKDRPDPVPS